MPTASRQDVVRLYRAVLRQAIRFPSVKRNDIIRDIRVEFRLNKHLTDPKKIEHCIAVAASGIETMKKYTGLDPASSDWAVELEKDPLGQAEYEARMAATMPASDATASAPAPAAPATSRASPQRVLRLDARTPATPKQAER